MTRSPAQALRSWVPPSAKLRSISSRWNGSKNSPVKECGLPRRSQEAQCNAFIAVKKAQRLRRGCRLAQPQRTEPLEMPEGAPELLARIGAEHRIELAVAFLPAGRDRPNRREAMFRGIASPHAAERCSGRRRSEPLT